MRLRRAIWPKAELACFDLYRWDGASSAAIKRALAIELATATLVPAFLRKKRAAGKTA